VRYIKGCMIKQISCRYLLLVLSPLFGLAWGCHDRDSGSVVPPEGEEMGEMDPDESLGGSDSREMLLEEPGITDAYFHQVDEVLIDDDIPVIGIEVDGVFRAFLDEGLMELDQHVVHTEQNGQPITIAYCDITDCVRVYHRSDLATTEIMMGGMLENQLALMVKGSRYRLDDEQIPLEQHPLTRTTWGEWKKAHPETDIYVGIGMVVGPTVIDGAKPPRTTAVGMD